MCKKTKEQKFIMLPSVDFCFQELMEDEEVRRGFIGAFLRIPPEEILDMELLPKKLRKKYKEEKYGILDVRVRLREGEQLNIEMQSIAYDYWQERSLFYLGKMYVDQIHEGEDYDKLKKCIHVGSMNIHRQNSFDGHNFSVQGAGRKLKCWQKKMNISIKHMINWKKSVQTRKND